MIDIKRELVGFGALILRFFRPVLGHPDFFLRVFQTCNCHFNRSMMLLINEVNLLIL